MSWKRFIQNYAKAEAGFTLMEMMVASFIGLLILSMLLVSTLSSKNLYRLDAVRTRINQDIRGTLDIIGSQVRVAGENFSGTFPAIQVVNNANGTSDSVTLRRNLLDEVLKVCVPITSGSSNDLYLASGSGSGCSYSDNTHNFTSWSDYRTAEGGTVEAYIFNTGTKLGEFFDYDGETNSGTEYSVSRGAGTWGNDFDATASAAYIMQEWTFQLDNNTLQLVVNGDVANTLNVAFGISDFQVVAVLQDGTEVDDFTVNDDWTELRAIRITTTGEDTFKGQILERTLTTEFFPRNVLSN